MLRLQKKGPKSQQLSRAKEVGPKALDEIKTAIELIRAYVGRVRESMIF